MPKRKQTYEFTLNADQMNYIGWAKRKYELPDDSKTVRIITGLRDAEPGPQPRHF